MPRFGIDKNIVISDGLNDKGLAVVTIPEVQWGEDAEEWLTEEDAKTLITHLQKVFSLPAGVSPVVDE